MNAKERVILDAFPELAKAIQWAARKLDVDYDDADWAAAIYDAADHAAEIKAMPDA